MQRLGMRALATVAVEARPGPPAPPKDQVLTQEPGNNVTEYIYSKMGVNLHHQPNHPIGIIKQVCVDSRGCRLIRKTSNCRVLCVLCVLCATQPARVPWDTGNQGSGGGSNSGAFIALPCLSTHLHNSHAGHLRLF
jgi:hypothetical protein